ncbi:uncharacterized protein LOC124117685 [Haliotis rufescens]|uniref:uncharacterized protein LOC124117685 n=1 Tax=Haliotis rufescens TaxID=6454 RepID=UPI00201E9984|nr:uncharacterized protein LOC124117685 [Haliotis rufescens]
MRLPNMLRPPERTYILLAALSFLTGSCVLTLDPKQTHTKPNSSCAVKDYGQLFPSVKSVETWVKSTFSTTWPWTIHNGEHGMAVSGEGRRQWTSKQLLLHELLIASILPWSLVKFGDAVFLRRRWLCGCFEDEPRRGAPEVDPSASAVTATSLSREQTLTSSI